MTPLDPQHPNLHLGQGRSRRNEQRRRQLLELLAWRGAVAGEGDEGCIDDPNAATVPLSFAEIAEALGISRERVRVLAKREGVVGRVKAREKDDAGKTRTVRKLRGQRRWFKKDDQAADSSNEGDSSESS